METLRRYRRRLPPGHAGRSGAGCSPDSAVPSASATAMRASKRTSWRSAASARSLPDGWGPEDPLVASVGPEVTCSPMGELVGDYGLRAVAAIRLQMR